MSSGLRDGNFDAAVVGAGLMGSATAWSLARRGSRVLLVDQFTPANRHGSSHGSARIVRRAYGDALYTRLTGQAFELWRELEDQSDERIIRMLGGLDFGTRRDVREVAEQLSDQGVPHELMPASEAERRWPGMRFAGRVLYHPQAGTIDARLAVQTFIGEATRLGAVVAGETAVLKLLPGEDRTELELADGERVSARVVVAAAGAWTEPLLRGLVALPLLVVTQQQVFHFARLDSSAEPWPSTIHDEREPLYHLAGGADGGPGDDRKLAEHTRGTHTTAAERDGEIDPTSRARVVEYVERWLPGLDPTPRSEASCLYTSTQSEDFILDRIGSLVICSACSGHGAKFAPLIGELNADLATAPEKAEIPPRFRLRAHGAAP